MPWMRAEIVEEEERAIVDAAFFWWRVEKSVDEERAAVAPAFSFEKAGNATLDVLLAGTALLQVFPSLKKGD